MAKRKRYYKKRYRGFKKYFQKYQRYIPFNKKIAYKIGSMWKINKLTELKISGFAYGTTTITTAGLANFSSPCFMSQGNTSITRIGNRVLMKSMWFRGCYKVPTQSSQSSDQVMMALVLDRQCNGAFPAYGDVFGSSNWLSFPLTNNEKRFKILYSNLFSMNANLITGVPNFECSPYICEFYKKFKKPIEIRYNANNGTVADINGNCLFWTAISKHGLAVIEDGAWRIRFIDP